MAIYNDLIHFRTMNSAHEQQGLQEIWRHNRGTGIIIAVLSTGVINHYMINNQIIGGKNFTTDHGGDVNNYSEILTIPNTKADRGTIFSSIVAGKSVRNMDYTHKIAPEYQANYESVGIAPETKLLIGKVKLSSGVGDTLQTTIDGINWAKDWVGTGGEKVDIILLDHYTTVDEPTYKAAIDAAVASGILIVSSTNDTATKLATTVYPAMYSNVLTFLPVRHYDDTLSTGNWPFNAGVNPNISADIAISNDVAYLLYWNKIEYYNGGSDSNTGGAVGAGFLALILQAYKEVGTPLTTKEAVMAELPKYARPINPVSNASLLSDLGVMQLNLTKLPNTTQTTATEYVTENETFYIDRDFYTPVSVPVEIIKKVREIVVPMSTMGDGGGTLTPENRIQQIQERINKLNSMQKK